MSTSNEKNNTSIVHCIPKQDIVKTYVVQTKYKGDKITIQNSKDSNQHNTRTNTRKQCCLHQKQKKQQQHEINKDYGFGRVICNESTVNDYRQFSVSKPYVPSWKQLEL